MNAAQNASMGIVRNRFLHSLGALVDEAAVQRSCPTTRPALQPIAKQHDLCVISCSDSSVTFPHARLLLLPPWNRSLSRS